ncbi:MAG: alanine dehydrogenase, partial [Polaribacter sp.]|nr:alanine dehydrogenase [Polaribacter sp.]
VASSIRCSSITNSIYGYNPEKESEDDFRKQDVITVMAVDNLPCELPKDASTGFGENLLKYIIPNLLGDDVNNVIERATICENGKLKKGFRYLENFVMNDDK